MTTSLAAQDRLQRRTISVLIAGQILGGLGLGVGVSTGALLVASVSGSDALSGLSATMLTLGTAIASMPLAKQAVRAGRRWALITAALVAAAGAALVITFAAAGSTPGVLASLALLGVGSAGTLQARFAATDLARPERRGRDLSMVVWSVTVGAVTGPNLLALGDSVGMSFGLPHMAGSFLLTFVVQLLAALLYFVALRPDPLLTARGGLPVVTPKPQTRAERGPLPTSALLAFIAVSASHMVMLAVMSMTPVHLTGHGAGLEIVGFTISLHVAGMYALSPVFGMLADRWGRVPVLGLGLGILMAAVLITAFLAEDHFWVTVGLFLLGLGWSAATVSASVLLTESVPAERRPAMQGRADALMSFSGAFAGACAGPVLSVVGYSGLSLGAGLIVVVVAILVPLLGRRLVSSQG